MGEHSNDNNCYDEECLEDDSESCIVDPAKIGSPKIDNGEISWDPPDGLSDAQVEIIRNSIKYINWEVREGRKVINQDGTVGEADG